ncbi:MAG: TolC family protein [Verrucomicrobiota bacterium]|nr:TolC family protein [Verrucomicrobiota bacterium]
MKTMITVLLLLNLAREDAWATTNPVVLSPGLIGELVEEARTNSPVLRAAEARVRAAEANSESIPLWENPELLVGGVAAPREMRMEEGDIVVGVEQALPINGKARAARRLAREEGKIAELQNSLEYQNLRKEIAIAAFSLALAEEQLLIARENHHWLQTTVEGMTGKLRAGGGEQVELLRMQAESARALNEIRNGETERDLVRITLSRLLNRSSEAAAPILRLPAPAPELVFNQRLVDLALKFEPQLQVLRATVKRAEAGMERAVAERRPDFSLGLEGRQYSGNGEFQEGAVFLKVSLPFFNQGKLKKGVSRERANIEAAESDLEAYRLRTREEVYFLWTRIDRARREALTYSSEVIPRAEQALESAQGAWHSNQDLFRNVLEARRMLVESRGIYFRAVKEQYQMMAELVLCCGLGDLESLTMILESAKEESN